MYKSYKRSRLRGTSDSTGEIGGRDMIPGEVDRKRSHGDMSSVLRFSSAIEQRTTVELYLSIYLNSFWIMSMTCHYSSDHTLINVLGVEHFLLGR